MAPLYYIFKHKNGTLDDLDNVCNVGKVLKTVSKRMIFSRSTVHDSVQRIQDVYVVPKNDVNVKKAMLDGIRDRLNAILDEFTPEFGMDTSFQYIQVMDCSLALYNMIQEHTKCSDQNSNAFCSDYAKESEYTSGLYYFLDYTMAEVPFAWWHKCMLMKGRTFASQNVRTNAVIQCDEWYKDTIKESMLNLTSYRDGDVFIKLQRLEGGITSGMVMQQIEQFNRRISKSVKNFVNGGQASFVEEKDSASLFLHKGAPSSFNLKCYNQTRFPMDNLTRYKTQTRPDCILEMLNWIHNEATDLFTWSKFNSIGPFSKNKDKSCYSLDSSDLESVTASDTLVPPFQYILQNTIGMPMDSESVLDEYPIYSDVVFNDFFQGLFNDAGGGLLVSELKPKKPSFVDDFLSDKLTSLKDVIDPYLKIEKFENSFGTGHNKYPCVTLSDIEGRLPGCEPNSLRSVKLTKRVCDTMSMQNSKDLDRYARRIGSYPSDFPQRKFPPDDRNQEIFMDRERKCFWDCGIADPTSPKLVHVGLNSSDLQFMKKVLLDARLNECYKYATAGTYVYKDPYKIQDAGIQEAIADVSAINFGIVEQEVCGMAWMRRKKTEEECWSEDQKNFWLPWIVEKVLVCKDAIYETVEYRK